jgi:hypothetical protein
MMLTNAKNNAHSHQFHPLYKKISICITVCLIVPQTRPRPTNALSILSPNKMKPPIPISEEIGKSPTFNDQFFDPLNLANEDNFAMYREAELKHGRVAMFAVLGNTLPDVFRDKLVPPPSVYLSPSHDLHFRDVPSGLKALSTVPLLGWIQIFVFIGFLETQVFVQRDMKDLPGDYGLGYFGLRDKSRHKR